MQHQLPVKYHCKFKGMTAYEESDPKIGLGLLQNLLVMKIKATSVTRTIFPEESHIAFSFESKGSDPVRKKTTRIS